MPPRTFHINLVVGKSMQKQTNQAYLLTTAIVSYYEVPSYRCLSDEIQSATRDALTHSFSVTIQVGRADPLLKPKLNHNANAGLNEYEFGPALTKVLDHYCSTASLLNSEQSALIVHCSPPLQATP